MMLGLPVMLVERSETNGVRQKGGKALTFILYLVAI